MEALYVYDISHNEGLCSDAILNLKNSLESRYDKVKFALPYFPKLFKNAAINNNCLANDWF